MPHAMLLPLPPLPDTPEGLLEVYRLWWNPRARPRWSTAWPGPPVVHVPSRPRCGAWYDLPAAVPATATWALVCRDWLPGRVRFATSRAAAVAMLEEIALRDHPHTRLVRLGGGLLRLG